MINNCGHKRGTQRTTYKNLSRDVQIQKYQTEMLTKYLLLKREKDNLSDRIISIYQQNISINELSTFIEKHTYLLAKIEHLESQFMNDKVGD